MYTQLSSKKRRLSWWLITAALIAALLVTTTAFAEGEEPADPPVEEPAAAETEAPPAEQAPAESPPEEAAPPPDEGAPAEEPAAEEPAPEEGAPAEEPAAEAGVEMVEAVDVVEEIAVELAEADITLVDGDGEALTMAAEETAQEIVVADPWFTAGSQTYRWLPFWGNCAAYPGDICVVSPTDTPIQDMLDYIQTTGTIPNYGKVYIEAGSFPETVHLDGTMGPGIPPFLSLLKGMYGAGAGTNPLVDTIINGDLEINHTTSGFTLQGLTVLGEIFFHDNSGTLTLRDVEASNPNIFGTGIIIGTFPANPHNGNVILEEVKADKNVNCGAIVLATGNITITNSSFDHNNAMQPSQGLGLYVDSQGGRVSINGISASSNDGKGLWSVGTPGGVTIRNSVFNYNSDSLALGWGYGLDINSNGNVTLEYVQAQFNGDMGVHVDALKNISVKNLDVNGTWSGPGAHLHTDNGSGSVTLNGAFFQNNTGFGLLVESSKSITVNSLWAKNNGAYGVKLDNWLLGSGSGNVSVKSPASAGTYMSNQFNQNWGGHGIEIATRGHVYLYNFDAGQNFAGSGVFINNSHGPGNVVLSTTLPDWGNSADMNGNHGLEIYSNGSISLNKTSAFANGGYGATLENWFSPSIKPVTVKNGWFDNNGKTGLYVISRGTIILNQVDANNNNSPANTQSGAYLNNLMGNGSVYVYGGTNWNSFSNNDNYGLYIITNGYAKVYRINAHNNNNTNLIIIAGKAVTVRDVDSGSSSAGCGLDVWSTNTIYVDNFNTDNNSSYGIALDNTAAVSAKKVTLKNINSYHNGNNGVNINSLGSVYFYDVYSGWNQGHGALVNTCQNAGGCLGSGGVYISGSWNDFSDNTGHGLYVDAVKTISVKNVRADWNGSGGAYLHNAYGISYSPVIISRTKGQVNSFRDNNGRGLHVYSNGAISVSYVDANSNNGMGAYLQNNALYVKSLTVKYSQFNHNEYYGLQAFSNGSIRLYNVEAWDNSIHHSGGINFAAGETVHEFANQHEPDQWHFFSAGPTLTAMIELKSSYFDAYLELYDSNWNLVASDDNGGGGSDALITLIAVTVPLGGTGDYYILASSAADGLGTYQLALNDPAYLNPSWYQCMGVYLYNQYVGATGGVSIKKSRGMGGAFGENSGTGLHVRTNGPVYLDTVDSVSNGRFGAYIDNSGFGKSVALKKSWFDVNFASGLTIYTSGTVSWSTGGASDNVSYGAYIDNTYDNLVRNISISRANFDRNMNNSGLWLSSMGNVLLSYITANDNNSRGAYIDACHNTGSGCTGVGYVKISGSGNEFNNNKNSDGLYVQSVGSISVYNTDASGNLNGSGVYLLNNMGTGSVTVKHTSSRSYSNFDNNGNNGLHVNSAGTVAIANVSANSNGSTNVSVYNANGALPKTISLKRVRSRGGGSSGFHITGSGSVIVNDLWAFGSGWNGLYINNTYLAAPYTVTIYKVKLMNNSSDNLVVQTFGNVTLGGIQSIGSIGGCGALINNQIAGATGKVTLSSRYGENYFSFNNREGLCIFSNNNVALNKVNAVSNGRDGVNVNTQGYVTVKYAQTHNNGWNGIDVATTKGAYIYKMWSANNGWGCDIDGLYLNVGAYPVSILYSSFTGNQGNGIEVVNATSLNLTGTSYFGNDSNANGDSNLYWH